ncbi:FtsW/RodA/SpoVE family cell cycle protein [Diplocloster hominis]|uniref:FtsW/RodA/SpoVE family cell cycle protein n=1 Tax=Diplocloster hominis TaxID=3079010 RepID=UPI0031BA4B22
MESFNKIDAYVATVQDQIRCRKIRSYVTEEIRVHLEEERSFLLEAGITDPEATDTAIKEMGDPVDIGVKLDRIHRPRMDWFLYFGVVALCLVGFLIQFLIRSDGTGSQFTPLYRHLTGILIGIAAMTLICRLDFTLLSKHPYIIWTAYWIGLFIYSDFAPKYNGRTITLLPYMLLFIPLFAGLVYSTRGSGYGGLLKNLLFLLLPGILCLIIPSASASALVIGGCLILMSIAICKNWFRVKRGWALLCSWSICVIPLILLLYNNGGYRFRRLQVLLHPSAYADNEGYMIMKLRGLIGQASMIGGLSNSEIVKNLPEISTDYLLSYVIIHFGWIPAAVLIALLAAFLIHLFRLSARQTNALGYLVSMACSCTLTLEILLYLIVNLGIFHMAPLALPFFSYGGRWMVLNLCIVGLLLSVHRTRTILPAGRLHQTSISHRFFTFENGRLNIRCLPITLYAEKHTHEEKNDHRF